MAEYKNQHYIPQSYFKLFSGDGRSIYVYNIESKEVKKKGIKNLCSESYFYSKEPILEKNNKPLEDESLEVIRKLVIERDMTKFNSKEYYIILRFLCFQYARTKKEKIDSEKVCDAIAKSMLKEIARKKLNDPKNAWSRKITMKSFNKYLEGCKIIPLGPGSSSIPHLLQMSAALLSPILIIDLKPLLLINKTELDFVFSDAPIILYNAFFYGKEPNRINCLASNGLQILCPLSPKVMLLLYDDKFYNFVGVEKGNLLVTNDSDIDSLNSLQFFSHFENIFFSNNSQLDNINALHSRLVDQIDTESIKESWVIFPSSFGQDMYMRGYSKTNINYELKLSFMILTSSPIWDGLYRSPMLIDEFDKKFSAFISELEPNL